MSRRSTGFFRGVFGGLWRLITWLRVTLLNLIFLLILAVVLASFWPEAEVNLEPDSTLVLSPTGILVDEYTYIDAFTQLVNRQTPMDTETLLPDLIKTIDLAAADSNIKSMVLTLDQLAGGGTSKLEELGSALQRFKDTGKPIYTYATNFSQQQYYLASYANEIYLNPLGSVALTGFANYRNYYKDAIDKLAINVHVFRAGEYKDYLEPMMRNDMSQASKENNQLWLDELWGVFSSRLEQQRSLPKGALNDFINTMDRALAVYQGNAAKLALEAGLVDRLYNEQQWQSFMEQQVGKDGVNGIDGGTYLHIKQGNAPVKQVAHIGVLTARGAISEGDLPAGDIGDQSFLKALDSARRDDQLKALVIRIDSGGGGVQASENIRQGLIEFAEETDIPLLVSMGSVAASGGYWMATAADEIWATPTTITGSIGVFGALPTFENTLAKLGIYTDGLSTTQLAGSLRTDTPLSPMAKSLLQQGVDYMYRMFLSIVADARDSSPEAINTIAQGRVWSGTRALELGLVDDLGGLQDVIRRAAVLAELEDYQVTTIAPPKTPMEQFVAGLSNSRMASAGQALLAPASRQAQLPSSFQDQLQVLAEPWRVLDSLNDPRGLYAQCWSCQAP